MVLPQHIARFLAAAQVLGKRFVGVAETAQIDDPPDARGPRGLGEVGRGGPVLFLEVAIGSHRMHEIVRRVDAKQRRRQRRRVEDVAGDRFGGRTDSPAEGLGTPGKTADTNTPPLQPRQQPPADISRRAGQQDQSAIVLFHHESPLGHYCVRTGLGCATQSASVSTAPVQLNHLPARNPR